MMYRSSFLLLLVCHGRLCLDCVTEDFENGFGSNFTNTYGWCNGINMWDIETYSSLNLKSPHPKSTSFITLQTTWTCMTSFMFMITKGGTLEVNRYMTSRYFLDNVNIEVIQYDVRGNDFVVASGSFSPGQPDFVRGWQILRIPIPGSGEFKGYFRFWGRASPSSVALIDSFRYIAPSLDEDLCVIYQEEKSTTDVPTTSTTSTELPTDTPALTTAVAESSISTTTTTESSTVTTTSTKLPTITTTTIELPTTTTIITESPSVITTSTELPALTTTTKELPTTTTTTTELSTTTKKTTDTPSTTMTTTTPVTSTTPSTETPRLSISILLVKIKKFFR